MLYRFFLAAFGIGSVIFVVFCVQECLHELANTNGNPLCVANNLVGLAIGLGLIAYTVWFFLNEMKEDRLNEVRRQQSQKEMQSSQSFSPVMSKWENEIADYVDRVLPQFVKN